MESRWSMWREAETPWSYKMFGPDEVDFPRDWTLRRWHFWWPWITSMVLNVKWGCNAYGHHILPVQWPKSCPLAGSHWSVSPGFSVYFALESKMFESLCDAQFCLFGCADCWEFLFVLPWGGTLSQQEHEGYCRIQSLNFQIFTESFCGILAFATFFLPCNTTGGAFEMEASRRARLPGHADDRIPIVEVAQIHHEMLIWYSIRVAYPYSLLILVEDIRNHPFTTWCLARGSWKVDSTWDSWTEWYPDIHSSSLIFK